MFRRLTARGPLPVQPSPARALPVPSSPAQALPSQASSAPRTTSRTYRRVAGTLTLAAASLLASSGLAQATPAATPAHASTAVAAHAIGTAPAHASTAVPQQSSAADPACTAGEFCLWDTETYSGAVETYDLRTANPGDCIPLPEGFQGHSFVNRMTRDVTIYQGADCSTEGDFITYPGHGTYVPRSPFAVRAVKVWE